MGIHQKCLGNKKICCGNSSEVPWQQKRVVGTHQKCLGNKKKCCGCSSEVHWQQKTCCEYLSEVPLQQKHMLCVLIRSALATKTYVVCIRSALATKTYVVGSYQKCLCNKNICCGYLSKVPWQQKHMLWVLIRSAWQQNHVVSTH